MEPRIPKESAPFDTDGRWTRTWIMYFESLFDLSVEEAVKEAGTVTHKDGELTKDLPVFGNGKDDVKVGTKSGNTNEVATVAGAVVTGNTVQWDADGNLIDAGVTPGGGGGGGGVSSVTGTAPIASSGGATPNISIAAFTGDSGSGGAKGAVPAPAAGDAAAGKILGAGGGWVAGGSGGTPAYISSLIAGPDTTKTITGATHGYATAGLLVQVYDNASPRNAIAAGWTVNSSTFDVIITFASAQSNYYVVINGATGPAGPTGPPGSGSGTVTSVALTVPVEFSVSGSPVTTSGTLAVSKATQSANTVYAGPTTGSAAAPTFRAVDPADLPLASSSAFGAVKVDGTTITAASGVISSVGGGATGPDAPPTTPSAIDDEFNGTSLDAKWAWVNQGGGTATLSVSWLDIYAPASPGDSLHCLVQAMPSTPWTITAKVSAVSNPSDYFFTGLVARDSGSGKLVNFTLGYAGGESVTVWYYTNPTTYSSAPYTSSVVLRLPAAYTLYLRWIDNGSNWTFQYSRNGAGFVTLQSGVSRTAFLASPNQVGIVTNRNNASLDGHGLFDWYRKV